MAVLIFTLMSKQITLLSQIDFKISVYRLFLLPLPISMTPNNSYPQCKPHLSCGMTRYIHQRSEQGYLILSYLFMSQFIFHEEGFRILRLAYYQICHLVELSAQKGSMEMCKITVVKSDKTFPKWNFRVLDWSGFAWLF